MRFIGYRKGPVRILGLLLLTSTVLNAQNSPTSPNQGNPTPAPPPPPAPSSNTGVYSGRDIYVPAPKEKEKEPEAAATTLADGFLRNTRKHLGFSVSASEAYTPGVLATPEGRKGLASTSLVPQLYLNFQKKQFAFHVNYSVSYNRYSTDVGEPDLLQNGSAGLAYTLGGRKTTFQFTDYLASNYSDVASGLSSGFTNPYQITATNPQIYIQNTRTNRNVAALSLTYAATKRISLSSSLNYDSVDYKKSAYGRSNQLSGSVGVGVRVKKWLNLNTRYSRYLNHVDPKFRGTNIQDLQIGEFAFKPARTLIITVSGGVESTKAPGVRSLNGSGRVSVEKKSPRTTIGLGYHRGLYTAFPAPEVWYGDSASLFFVRSITSRTSVHANSSFTRGSVGQNSSTANSLYGGASFDVVLQRNLVLATNYFVVSQKFANIELSGATAHRSTVSVSLQYYLPSVARR